MYVSTSVEAIEILDVGLYPLVGPTYPWHLYINSGRWYLPQVPSTFATVNTHANVFFVFLPACGISKEWRHIVSANCDFEGNLPGQYRVFTGLSGNTWGDQK